MREFLHSIKTLAVVTTRKGGFIYSNLCENSSDMKRRNTAAAKTLFLTMGRIGLTVMHRALASGRHVPEDAFDIDVTES